ncbi:MAG TPA: ISL3 family transposase, partial [Ktedonobacteraceae bacterium]
MSVVEKGILSSCLCLPETIDIASIAPSAACLMVQVASHALTARCPLCQQVSERIHDRYVRTVADVPCGGRRVMLELTVRKFVCSTPTCPRKVFTERLPELVQPYARMTHRLHALLQTLGLVAGGEGGSRLASQFGIHTTPPTLLCHLMALEDPPVPHVRVLGIDDWSWKKRQRYGTILVDLEAGKIIDVLSDRKAATVKAWLAAHPEVEFVSRDRGTDYSAAVRDGAPQAIQVVDRFHLVRNLAEVLQVILARCRTEICRAHQHAVLEPARAEEIPTPLPTPHTWQQRTPAVVGRRHQARQASRDDRYTQILSLRALGLKQTEIAARVGMSV